jgi:hypothetical protein
MVYFLQVLPPYSVYVSLVSHAFHITAFLVLPEIIIVVLLLGEFES